MIKEKLVISDTNILLDLLAIGMLDYFFLLPCDFYTTDFVINEIKRPEQLAEIGKHIKARKLNVVSFNYKELVDINALKINSTISMTDCSVWYYAKGTGGRLLTGDGKLRKSAEKDNVKVSGLLYIFDNLVEHGVFSKPIAATLLKHLSIINPRLPKQECEKRIDEWKMN